MRIVAGALRGRRLRVPPGLALRPTGDRAREALFSILAHGEPPLAGAAFLDVFAGTGAVAIEALSRGAAKAVLVENDPRALATLRANLEALGVTESATVLRADATRLGRAREAFTIAFLDPPYHSGLAMDALAVLLRGGWLAPDARLVVETASDEKLAPPTPLEIDDTRRYGAARFHFLRLSG